MRSLESYFGVYFPRCCALWEINAKLTLSWAHKLFSIRAHTLFYIYSPEVIYHTWSGSVTVHIVIDEPDHAIPRFHRNLDGNGMAFKRHEREALSALLIVWEGNHPATTDRPHKGGVMRSFDVLLVVSLNTLSGIWEVMTPMWCLCNEIDGLTVHLWSKRYDLALVRVGNYVRLEGGSYAFSTARSNAIRPLISIYQPHGGTTEEGNCSYLLPLSHRELGLGESLWSCAVSLKGSMLIREFI